MISNMNALLVNSKIINAVILSCCEDLCENFKMNTNNDGMRVIVAKNWAFRILTILMLPTTF